MEWMKTVILLAIMDENADILVIVWRMKTKTIVAYHCNIDRHEKLNNLLLEIHNIVSL